MAGLTCSRCDRPRSGRGRYCAQCRNLYQRNWRVRDAERNCHKANMALQAAGYWVRLRVDPEGVFHVVDVKQTPPDWPGQRQARQ